MIHLHTLDRCCCLLLHLGSPFLEVQYTVLVDVALMDDVLNIGNLFTLDVQSLHHLEGTLHNTKTVDRADYRHISHLIF